jgi:hypothetical protein
MGWPVALFVGDDELPALNVAAMINIVFEKSNHEERSTRSVVTLRQRLARHRPNLVAILYIN